MRSSTGESQADTVPDKKEIWLSILVYRVVGAWPRCA